MSDRDRKLRTLFCFAFASQCSLGCYLIRVSRGASRLQRTIASVVVCLAIAGCGGEMKVAPVSGTVTLDGEPLERASVLFLPEKGRPSFGVTDEYGIYHLAYSRAENGAEVGDCTVKITASPPDGEEGKSAKKPLEKTGKRYAEEPIVVTVEPKGNTIDIELTSQR